MSKYSFKNFITTRGRPDVASRAIQISNRKKVGSQKSQKMAKNEKKEIQSIVSPRNIIEFCFLSLLSFFVDLTTTTRRRGVQRVIFQYKGTDLVESLIPPGTMSDEHHRVEEGNDVPRGEVDADMDYDDDENGTNENRPPPRLMITKMVRF